MKNVSCPDCLEDCGDAIESEVLETGLRKTFECGDCGHVWDVVF